MIVRRVPGGVLADREALATAHDRSQATIRARCVPAACDITTRRALYWSHEVEEMTRATPKRRRGLAQVADLIAP